MPFISIQLTEDINETQKQSIAEGVMWIMKHILGKQADLTALNFSVTSAKHWFINAENLDKYNEQSAFVTAHISENTNTKEEKAMAISAFYNLLDEQIGPIHPTSYVVLDETPMTDWGYEGTTQQERAIKRTETGAIDTSFYLHNGRKERAEAFQSVFNKLKSIFKMT